ncbi:MAG TPA: hypothetical protein VE783_11270, partial [Candidatus Limnocylindrales bacterium]|nr:hypothetical protein [Candidatus Limnocylindrales bacterium]
MARMRWPLILLLASSLPFCSRAQSKEGQISSDEAESLVQLVLRHQKIRLDPHYCGIELLKGFVPDQYSFSVACD